MKGALPTSVETAVALAHRLLGQDAFEIDWGGRTRLVSKARDALSRASSVISVPAHLRRARAVRAFVALSVALGSPPRLARRRYVSDWPLYELTGLEPVDALIGTPGPYQAVMVRLAAPETRRIEGIAKVMVSTSRGAWRRVRNELEAMRDAVLGNVAPEVLAESEFEGHPLFVMRYVRGRPLGAGARDLRFAASVIQYQVSARHRLPRYQHPWLRRVGRLFPTIELDRLPAHVGVVRTHGDFAPWNVIRTPEGRLVVIDWEASTAEGLPGVDLAYYLLAVERYLHKRSPTDAARYAVRSLAALEDRGASESGVLVALAAAGAVLGAYAPGQPSAVDRYWEQIISEASG